MIWAQQKEDLNIEMMLPEELFKVVETWNPDKYDPDKWFQAASKAGVG